MKYSDLTWRYFKSALYPQSPPEQLPPPKRVAPSNAETLQTGTPRAFRGSAGNLQQGTWVQFDVRAVPHGIVEARFLAFGCPHTIAVAAWITEGAAGKALSTAISEPVAELARLFDVPAEKMGRLLIIEDAWLSLKEL